jgi:hypothetical protein
MAFPVLAVLPLADKILDLIGDKFPSEKDKQEAKLRIMQAEAAGDLEVLKTQLSAILAEANSEDPWTSRARPSFMYVMYTMLVFGIPMGFVAAFDPAFAGNVAAGFKAWLTAIPDELYALFGVGYVGYAAVRTYDKRTDSKERIAGK